MLFLCFIKLIKSKIWYNSIVYLYLLVNSNITLERFAMKNKINIISAFILTAFSSITLNALSFAVSKNYYNYNLIYASGKIRHGDLYNLRKTYNRIANGKQTIVVFNSGGGELQEGLRIGRFLKDNRIGSAVIKNGMCASSCALAFLGGRDLYGRKLLILPYGSKLGYHRFYYRNREYVSAASMGRDFASVLDYANYVNAPTSLLAKMFDTKFTNMHWIRGSERRLIGVIRGLPQVNFGVKRYANRTNYNNNVYHFTQTDYVTNYISKMNKIIRANKGIIFDNETAFNDSGYQSWISSNLRYISIKRIRLVRTDKVVADVVYTLRNGTRIYSKNTYYLTQNSRGWKIYAKRHQGKNRISRRILRRISSILP